MQTVRLVPRCGGSVPPVSDKVIQGELDVPETLQETVLEVRLVTTYVMHCGANGPPAPPLEMNEALGTIESESGASNASTDPAVKSLEGDFALKPRPRFENAAQSASRFTPPLSTS